MRGARRFNQTINHIIGKLLYTDSGMPQERPWLDVLPDALFAYNTRIHSAHNHSPFQVFRGRAPHGQIPVQQDETTEEDTRELITKRAEWLASFRGQVRHTGTRSPSPRSDHWPPPLRPRHFSRIRNARTRLHHLPSPCDQSRAPSSYR